MSKLIVTGNLSASPELRYTASGKAVATFTVMENRRRKSDQGWVDDEPNAFNVEAWGALAENVAESLGKGDMVSVVGEVRTSRWQDRDTGDARSRQVIAADDVSASLRFATANITKASRTKNASHGEEAEPAWG